MMASASLRPGKTCTCTDEELRILRAVRDLRLFQNEHGRYVIPGEPRPQFKARKNLERWGFFIYCFQWAPGPGLHLCYRLSSAGAHLLERAEAGDPSS